VKQKKVVLLDGNIRPGAWGVAAWAGSNHLGLAPNQTSNESNRTSRNKINSDPKNDPSTQHHAQAHSSVLWSVVQTEGTHRAQPVLLVVSAGLLSLIYFVASECVI
jgi:hypothetical protein